MPEEPEDWEPSNGAERTMLVARARDDARAYLEVLARVPLCLPALAPSDDGKRQQFAVWEVDGHKHLLAFTSPAAMAASMGAEAAQNPLVVNYPELVNRWPDPTWRLAVNPNLPIDFFTGIAEIGQWLGTLERPATLDEVVASDDEVESVDPAAEREDDILRALATGDGQKVLEALVKGWVHLPTAAPVENPDAIDWDVFPWLIQTGKTGEARVVAFTSAARAKDSMPPDTPLVYVPLVRLAQGWPRNAERLVIDPGLPGQIPLSAEALSGLPDWQDDIPAQAPSGRSPLVGGVLTGAGRRKPPAGSLHAPTPVVKVLAPGAAEGYLRLGYGRVSGFAYLADAVADIRTPDELYAALGLASPASPFRPGDPVVHLIRWDAYCPKLYPVAYGGCSEPTLAMIGGWVIEPDPFVGTGVAPGLVAAAEMKVAGVVLPHGAQLRQLDADGDDILLATWDADVEQWLTEQDKDVVKAMTLR